MSTANYPVYSDLILDNEEIYEYSDKAIADQLALKFEIDISNLDYSTESLILLDKRIDSILAKEKFVSRNFLLENFNHICSYCERVVLKNNLGELRLKEKNIPISLYPYKEISYKERYIKFNEREWQGEYRFPQYKITIENPRLFILVKYFMSNLNIEFWE